MGKVVDFQSARTEKEDERKEAKAKKLKSSFESSRQASESKSKAAEKLKKLFRNPSPKTPFSKPPK